jgi:hypothetical protein
LFLNEDNRMTRVTSSFTLLFALILSSIGASSVVPLHAQTAPKPAAPQPKAPAKAPARPPARTPAPAPAAAKAEPAAPPKPVAQDLHMKTVYTAADQKTESVTYQKGARERFEFGGDVILLKQHDLKRTVQIMRAANVYMVVPDGAPPAMPVPAAAPNTPPQKPGVVTMATTIADTGERKTMFGMQARHVKMTIDRQPMPGACETTKQHIETDGWYVDPPTQSQPAQDVVPQQPAPAGCVDEVKATQNGDPKVLGFPISYSTTITGEDGKPNVVAMEITEFERTNLDAALFDIPPGMNDAGNLQALSKAVSDVNETKLAQELTAPAAPVQKVPGSVLVGVTEVVNKTTQQIDTRELRGRLVSELAGAKLNAAPLAGSQPDLVQQAAAHGYDYVLVAEITDLKTSKAGGGLGGMLKAASKVTGGGSNEDPAEAAVTIKLVQPDGKSRFSTTVKGKTGGLDLKTGLGVAKFAGGMYMNMMTGKMFMNALNPAMAGNLGGLGMLGNPAMMSMQTQGLGIKTGMQMGMGMGMGMGIDPTAGAASFVMQQSMASKALASGVPGQGPSFDAALGEAFQNAAKAVSENLKKAEPKKK